MPILLGIGQTILAGAMGMAAAIVTWVHTHTKGDVAQEAVSTAKIFATIALGGWIIGELSNMLINTGMVCSRDKAEGYPKASFSFSLIKVGGCGLLIAGAWLSAADDSRFWVLVTGIIVACLGVLSSLLLVWVNYLSPEDQSSSTEDDQSSSAEGDQSFSERAPLLH